MAEKETIAILGGTGDLGTGLAIRWSKAGHRIVIGSRTLEKARKAVADLHQISPRTPAEAMVNPDAAAAGDVVVLTVPAAHQISTLETVRASLKGKILIDVTVPLVPPRVGTVQLPGEGSAGKRAQDPSWQPREGRNPPFRTSPPICLRRMCESNATCLCAATSARRGRR